MKNETFEEVPDFLPVMKKEKNLKVISKKPILPTDVEINKNSRSRSAKLRVAERIWWFDDLKMCWYADVPMIWEKINNKH